MGTRAGAGRPPSSPTGDQLGSTVASSVNVSAGCRSNYIRVTGYGHYLWPGQQSGRLRCSTGRTCPVNCPRGFRDRREPAFPRRTSPSYSTVRRPASDRALTAALIELSDWLEGSHRDPAMPLSMADQATLREVATALRPLRRGLADRMQRPAIVASRHDTIMTDCFVDAPSFRYSAVHWKPEGAMWSSPAVGPGVSAWTLRTEITHDAIRHGHVVVLETPPVAAASCSDCLTQRRRPRALSTMSVATRPASSTHPASRASLLVTARTPRSVPAGCSPYR